MKVGLLLAIILLHFNALATAAFHGPNPIKRTVVCQIIDASTGEALTGVQVAIEGMDTAIWSDEDGKFIIEFPSEQSSKLTCSLVSFQSISLDVSTLEDGSVLYLSEK